MACFTGNTVKINKSDLFSVEFKSESVFFTPSPNKKLMEKQKKIPQSLYSSKTIKKSNKHIHDCSLFWLGAGSSIKRSGKV
jgi:hypothetical protein